MQSPNCLAILLNNATLAYYIIQQKVNIGEERWLMNVDSRIPDIIIRTASQFQCSILLLQLHWTEFFYLQNIHFNIHNTDISPAHNSYTTVALAKGLKSTIHNFTESFNCVEALWRVVSSIFFSSLCLVSKILAHES